jgi:lysophospholipase L1-like esterase
MTNKALNMIELHASRRKFLRNSSLAGLSAISIPQMVSAAIDENASLKKVKIKKDSTILFQGDSITDAGRKKEDPGFNNSGILGSGYAMLAAAEMLYKYPKQNLRIYNRGISGNKVYQLAERWEKDCISLKPNILSILIGVNDFWHKLNGNYAGTIQTYKDDLKALLDQTKQKLPEVQLIIGEPFAVPGIKAVDEKWYPAFNDYRAAAKEIATNFEAVVIPYQSVFDKAQQMAPGVYWTHDGVHPTLAGDRLMAEAWLAVVNQ